MDIADAIEETRRLKRRLCAANVGLTPEDVFRDTFPDAEHLKFLKSRIEERMAADTDPSLREMAMQIERLQILVYEDLPRPSDDDLCVRFSNGDLDARTVIDITGWSPDELYDRCAALGIQPVL